MTEKEPLGIISLNANGLAEIKKRRHLITWLKKFNKADQKIIFLQETHTTEKIEKRWKHEWNGR
jgi:exonuclease III